MTLREARFFKRFNQYDIALKTGISQSKISLIEKGYREASEVDKGKIAGALRLEPHEIDWAVSPREGMCHAGL